MEKLLSDWQEFLLERIKLAEDMGSCVVQRHLLNAFDRRVAETGSASLQEQFLAFKSRAEQNFRFEAEHGKGSLIAVNHPLNIQLRELGLLKSPPEPLRDVRGGLRGLLGVSFIPSFHV